MPFQERGHQGTTNGTTAVIAVPAPPKGVRRVIPAKGINIYNGDDANVTLTIRKADSAGNTWIVYNNVLGTLVEYIHDGMIVLDRTDHRIEVLLSGAANTVEPTFVTSWADIW